MIAGSVALTTLMALVCGHLLAFILAVAYTALALLGDPMGVILFSTVYAIAGWRSFFFFANLVLIRLAASGDLS